jgi:methylmalonyl-CoA/ethylmalonyl-CoA epimerase
MTLLADMLPGACSGRFHHVGFVVPSISACVDGFSGSLGATDRSPVFEDPIQRVRVQFLGSGQANHPQVELVEPLGEQSPVFRFLQQGGGLHHICYEVSDIEQQLARMRGLGASILRRPRPAVAFGGRRIAWVVTAQKLLIEYLEASGGPVAAD